MTALHELGVADIASRIRGRELSAIELVRALLERIEATEPTLRAWVMVDAERALQAARDCDAAAARGDGGPLNGVPIGLKDIYNVAGLPTKCGSTFLADTPAEEDAEAVARLRRAGAIVLGKTVTTPFAYADPPPTRNPWNVNRTPGGSSSGSAVALAARQVPAALGSQTAGSILRPAGYCGVVGLKPTFGRISRRGIHPVSWSLDHAGPIARSVEDAAELLQVLAGYDPADQGSRNRPVDDYRGAAAAPGAPTIGLVDEVIDLAGPPVRDHVRNVAERLERAGAQVRSVRLSEPVDLLLAVQLIIMQAEAGAVHAAQHARYAEAYPPRLRALVEIGQVLPAAGYLQAQRLRHRIRTATLKLFEEVDCLLTPTASNVAPDPSTTGDNRFQAIWTLLGFPSISLPSGLDSDGLPFSSQLTAGPWQEATLLGRARWCEQQLDPLPLPPVTG